MPQVQQVLKGQQAQQAQRATRVQRGRKATRVQRGRKATRVQRGQRVRMVLLGQVGTMYQPTARVRMVTSFLKKIPTRFGSVLVGHGRKLLT